MAETEASVCVSDTHHHVGDFLTISKDDPRKVELPSSALEEHDYFVQSGKQRKEVAGEELHLNFSETELRLGPPAAVTTQNGDISKQSYSLTPKTSKPSFDLLQDLAESAYQPKGAPEKPPKTVDRERSVAVCLPQQQQTVMLDPDSTPDGRNYGGILAAHESSASALKEANAATEREAPPPHDLDHHHPRAAITTTYAGGNLLYPTPVISITGTKRPFMEALGGSSTGGRRSTPFQEKPHASSLSLTLDSEASKLPHQQKFQLPSIFQANPSNASSFTSWKLGLEMVGGSFGPFPSPRAPKLDSENAAKPVVGGWPSPSAVPEGFPPASELPYASKSIRNSLPEEMTVSSTRAPVGWPPVQSFRKNSLPPPHPKTPIGKEDKPLFGNHSTLTTSKNKSHPLLVKVYMDGLGIGRKVDLKTHNSYEKLSTTLEDMFHKSLNAAHKVIGHNLAAKDLSDLEAKRVNFLRGSEYVITYEDKDGDLMLMGDVPWGMFEESVKRLRIMKGHEAIGLAPRLPDKANK